MKNTCSSDHIGPIHWLVALLRRFASSFLRRLITLHSYSKLFARVLFWHTLNCITVSDVTYCLYSLHFVLLHISLCLSLSAKFSYKQEREVFMIHLAFSTTHT